LFEEDAENFSLCELHVHIILTHSFRVRFKFACIANSKDWCQSVTGIVFLWLSLRIPNNFISGLVCCILGLSFWQPIFTIWIFTSQHCNVKTLWGRGPSCRCRMVGV